MQPLQQRSALVAIRMHTAKKEEELQKKKSPTTMLIFL
jgi:hypothetical protein